jgi:hypothetical protein
VMVKTIDRDISMELQFCLCVRKGLFFLLILLVSWSGVRLCPLGTSAINWPIVAARDDNGDECGTVGGTSIDRGDRSARRKPAPVPLFPS